MKKMVKEFGGTGARATSSYRDALNFAKTDQNFQTVTLEVTPEQAQQIVYVLSVFGESITLVLRNADDRQLQRTATTNLYDIMGEDSYLVRSQRLPPPAVVPRTRFYDFVGEQAVPVR